MNNISKEDFILWDNLTNKPKEHLDTVYHYTSVIDLYNEEYDRQSLGLEFRCVASLTPTWKQKISDAIELTKNPALTKAKKNVYTLVGRRFSTIEDILQELTKLGAIDPGVSEADNVDYIVGTDWCLDCCLDNSKHAVNNYDFTMFYLRDRDNNYYITEVNFI